MKNKNLSGGLFARQPTPLTIRETPLAAQIAGYLDNRRIYNDRLQCGQFQTPSGNWMRGSKRGTPDRFCIIRGQIIFIEVKMRNEKPAPEQIKRHDELCAAGAFVIVCDSFDVFIGKINAIRAAIEQPRKGEMNLYD